MGRREIDRMGDRGSLFLCHIGLDVGRRLTVLCPSVHPPVPDVAVSFCRPWWVVEGCGAGLWGGDGVAPAGDAYVAVLVGGCDWGVCVGGGGVGVGAFWDVDREGMPHGGQGRARRGGDGDGVERHGRGRAKTGRVLAGVQERESKSDPVAGRGQSAAILRPDSRLPSVFRCFLCHFPLQQRPPPARPPNAQPSGRPPAACAPRTYALAQEGPCPIPRLFTAQNFASFLPRCL